MTALRKLAGDVAVHVVIVGLAVGEVAVGIVVLIVVAIVVVSAGASGGTGVALGAARGAVSEPSLQCQTAVQCGSLLQVTVDVVMAIGGVMNGAVVAAAGAGLAVGDNRF
jgi:hypothetical protein